MSQDCVVILLKNTVYRSTIMHMDPIPTPIWTAAVAHHLHHHWRTVDPAQLEETACELLRDPALSKLLPADAVAHWLSRAASVEDGSTGVWGRFESREAPPF